MKFIQSALAAATVFSLSLSLIRPISVSAATQVDLGTAESFAVLAGSGITATPPSVIDGDVGLSPDPGTDITGITSAEVTGTIYAVDATGPGGAGGNNPVLVNGAKADLVAAYDDAEGQVTTGIIAADLGGQILTPGVYEDNDAPDSLSIAAGTTLTLDAQGDADAVFILKSGSTLVTGAGSSVNLINGAQACNVFWQVTSSATLGTSTEFEGNILALTSITDNGGSTINGRLLARNGAVTLNDTTIAVSTCATTPPSTTPGTTGSINVVKVVINDNGGTADLEDFPLFVNGTAVVSGIPGNFAAGTYTISETGDPGYTQSFSGDCDASGSLILSSFESAACIITNDDIGAPIVVPPVPPIIAVLKVPDPLALPAGPGSVTYSYTLRNIGTVPVTDVTMIDDSCGPVNFVAGDTDNDDALDVSETWTYSCSDFLAATTANTVVATGWANGLSATDVATATVVVGAPVVPPLIHVTKIPNPLTLLAGGGLVTYTETITNPGTVPLSNVTLDDDKCSPLNFISGDVNDDALLDPSESWVYTCQSTLSATTTNTATATGEANGITAEDIAIVTVVVATAAPAVPSLPDTGVGPATTSAGPIAAAGALTIATLLYLKRRKLAA